MVAENTVLMRLFGDQQLMFLRSGVQDTSGLHCSGVRWNFLPPVKLQKRQQSLCGQCKWVKFQILGELTLQHKAAPRTQAHDDQKYAESFNSVFFCSVGIIIFLSFGLEKHQK